MRAKNIYFVLVPLHGTFYQIMVVWLEGVLIVDQLECES